MHAGRKKGTGSCQMDLGGICTAGVDQDFWMILRVKQNPWARLIERIG